MFWLGFCAGLLAVPCQAAEWPQWRGANRDSVSTDRVRATWPAEGPRLVWRASVGTGFSSVSVAEGRAYTLGNTNHVDMIWCFDARTGKKLWSKSYPSKLDPQWYEGGPSATPTVDNRAVYTISKWGDVFCLDAVKGTVLWHRVLGDEGIRSNRWGFAGSPLIWRDLVILNAGRTGTALERRTGRIAWSTGTNTTGYASPTVFRAGGTESVLIFAAKHLVAVDPANGRELWRQFFETGWDTNITDPLIDGDRVFISSFSRGCILLSLARGKPEVVYDSKVLHNHLSPGVQVGEYLYAFNGEAKTETDFRCIHLPTGRLQWVCKDPSFGSLIRVGDKLLVLSGKGELLLVKPSPEKFEPIARAKVLSGTCWTPPTTADGFVYVRNAKGELRCLDLSTK